jgi:hypothetical protein
MDDLTSDTYSGDVDSIGPSPYGFNGTGTNAMGASQQATPLGGLAQALMQQYGGGTPGLTVGPVNAPTAPIDLGSDINLPQPGYTDPSTALGW